MQILLQKYVVFCPEYNFLATRTRLLQEINEGGLPCRCKLGRAFAPCRGRNPTRRMGYTRIEPSRQHMSDFGMVFVF